MTDPSNPSNEPERRERPKLTDREMSDLLDRVLSSMERLQEKVLWQEENVREQEERAARIQKPARPSCIRNDDQLAYNERRIRAHLQSRARTYAATLCGVIAQAPGAIWWHNGALHVSPRFRARMLFERFPDVPFESLANEMVADRGGSWPDENPRTWTDFREMQRFFGFREAWAREGDHDVTVWRHLGFDGDDSLDKMAGEMYTACLVEAGFPVDGTVAEYFAAEGGWESWTLEPV